MLRHDVTEAVRAGKFHVHAVGTVDEGIALLTGVPAATVHARVARRLKEFARSHRKPE